MDITVEEELVGSDMGLYDSATNGSLYADKVIDVSDLCPNGKQTLIKYCNAHRGRIAQLNMLYEKGGDLGSTVHYFINEMTLRQLAVDEVFKSHCNHLNASSINLAKAIFKYA